MHLFKGIVQEDVLCLPQKCLRMRQERLLVQGLPEWRLRASHQGSWGPKESAGEAIWEEGMQLQEELLQAKLLHLPSSRYDVRTFTLCMWKLPQSARSSRCASSSCPLRREDHRAQDQGQREGRQGMNAIHFTQQKSSDFTKKEPCLKNSITLRWASIQFLRLLKLEERDSIPP